MLEEDRHNTRCSSGCLPCRRSNAWAAPSRRATRRARSQSHGTPSRRRRADRCNKLGRPPDHDQGPEDDDHGRHEEEGRDQDPRRSTYPIIPRRTRSRPGTSTTRRCRSSPRKLLEIQNPNVETISGATDITDLLQEDRSRRRSSRPRSRRDPRVAELPGIRRVEQIMGMPIVVDVRDDEADDELLDEVFDWFRAVDATFSTYKDDSEISRLNRDELALRECSEDVRWVIARCRELRDETDGYFDAEAVVPRADRPVGARQGLVGRPRRGAARRGRDRATTSSTPAATSASAAAALPGAALARRDPAPADPRPDRGRGRGERSRGRDLGCLRPRRARRRPAHRPSRRRACCR